MESQTDTDTNVVVNAATDKIKRRLDRIEETVTAKYKAGVTKTRQGLLTCAEAVHMAQEKMIEASKLSGGLRYNEWLSKMKISQSTAERWLAVHEQREFIQSLPIISDSATVYYEFARLWSDKDQAKALQALGDTPKAITATEAKNIVNAITNPNQKAKPTDNQLPVLTEMMGTAPAPVPEPEDDLRTGPVIEPANGLKNVIVIGDDETDWLLPADKRTALMKNLETILEAYKLKGVKVTVERL
jgi:hypothetical protein